MMHGNQIEQNKSTLPVQIMGITFKGNATHDEQQDAMFVVDGWYQTDRGLTQAYTCNDGFCVAVSDGVADSKHAAACSRAVVQAVEKAWQQHRRRILENQVSNRPIMEMSYIHEQVAHAPQKYRYSSATLALVYRPYRTQQQIAADKTHPVVIKHVGDSRVYKYQEVNGKRIWQCLTRDHNLLNQMLDEQAREKGTTVNPEDYNREGMAGSLYALTECLMIDADEQVNPMPAYQSLTLNPAQGDYLLICSDGISDLMPCQDWPDLHAGLSMSAWLTQLMRQIYQSSGRAYDNGTAILMQFGQ